jgi:hypothetical protein
MYKQLIAELTANDRMEMAARGVQPARISEWKNKGTLPTRAQALALAEVKGVDPIKLETELMVLEAQKEAEKKPAMQRMLERLRGTHKALMI